MAAQWSILQAWRLVEYFAGDGNLTFCARILNFKSVSLDIKHGGRYMDLLTPSGMAKHV